MRLLLCIAVMRVKMLIGYFNEGLRSGVFFVFCILIISAVLEHKSSKRLVQKYIIFGILAVAAAVAYEFLHLGIENLVADYEAARGGEVTWFGNIMLSLSNLVQNMIPGVAVLLAALSLYKEKWEEKVFVTLLVLLMETIVLNVFCEITNLPFSAGIAEESHLYPPEWIRIGIEVLWLGVSAALFRMFLKNALLDTLNKIKGEVGKFLKLPIASYVIFLAVLAVIDLLGINFRSIYNANIFVAIVVIIGMMAMYVFMYAALFDAVRISAESAKVQADLMVASDIQQSVLPSVFPAFPERSEFDIYANMRPAREVGGDFYDFYLIDEDHLAFVIADVSGKGVAAALFMMAGRTTIRNQSVAGAQPGNILSNSNEQLLENNEKGLFITVFFAILNLKTGELKFSNAGHNAPYICRKDGTVEMLKMRHGFVLGGMEGIRYRTEENILHPGDKILLYTDGVTEAVNMELQLYGDDRLKAELERVQSQEIKKIVSDVTQSIDEFAAGAMQADDITMLIVEYKGESQKECQ